MSEGHTLLLGFVAGATILLGLPLGRVTGIPRDLRQFLNALAAGILIFLLWDVLAAAFEPVEHAVTAHQEGSGGVGPIAGYGLLFFGGLAVGLMALVYYERWLDRRGAPKPFGPGAMARDELVAARTGIGSWSAAKRLALMIAVGIGLHNFGEGLAIGGSAARGEIGLATVLVIGFALHNGTEGFGIVAPLAADDDRPSWLFLLVMGVIGGGPTFVGTLVGRQFTSEAVNVAFLALAAGSILYVVVQLLGVAHKHERKDFMYWGLLAGLAAGFITDMVVTAGGA